MWKKILLIIAVLVVLFLVFRNVDLSQPVLDVQNQESTATGPFSDSDNMFENEDVLFDGASMNENSLSIDTQASVLTWFGENKIQNKSHGGTLNFDSESFVNIATVNESPVIESGYIVVDMTTLAGNEGEPQGLINHLRSDKFFDVEVYPEARLSVVSATETDITAMLTIKDTSNEVTFPYVIEEIDEKYQITGQLTFDRTKWSINTLSGSIFDNIGDAVIEDNIVLTFTILTE